MKMAKFAVGQTVDYVGDKSSFKGRWRVRSIDTTRTPVRYSCEFQGGYRADPIGVLKETSIAAIPSPAAPKQDKPLNQQTCTPDELPGLVAKMGKIVKNVICVLIYE
ncbi:hypothetical protein AYO40_01020 [Planctomycetaceae bacterium SCGC AG-212-D15]|nr:hypothetical protein AYO40_01020 [Planctomycetaceae bacterium SCGC AG-212-D15]